MEDLMKKFVISFSLCLLIVLSSMVVISCSPEEKIIKKQVIQITDQDVQEKNASDPSLIHYEGQVIVYFTGGNQTVAGDLQWATFNGTIQELMESFYVQTEIPLVE